VEAGDGWLAVSADYTSTEKLVTLAVKLARLFVTAQ
jgi:hypothetical protein